MQTPDAQLGVLVPSESSGGFERDDVPSLQLQATGAFAPKARRRTKLWVSLKRWEPPPPTVLSTPQRGHRLLGRAPCPNAGQIGLAVGAPAMLGQRRSLEGLEDKEQHQDCFADQFHKATGDKSFPCVLCELLAASPKKP